MSDDDFRREMKKLSDDGRNEALGRREESRRKSYQAIERQVREKIISRGEIISEEEILKRIKNFEDDRVVGLLNVIIAVVLIIFGVLCIWTAWS